jgi:hypothetical protein
MAHAPLNFIYSVYNIYGEGLLEYAWQSPKLRTSTLSWPQQLASLLCC